MGKLKLIWIRRVLLVVVLVLLRIRSVLLGIGSVLLGIGVLGWNLLSLFFLLFLRLGLRFFYLNGFVIDFHLIGFYLNRFVNDFHLVGIGELCELLFSYLSGLHSGSSLRSSQGLFCFHFWGF